MSNERQATRASTVQSVDRALAVMEILGREGWAGVTDIARELDIHKSTVFRLLATLERRGMVEQHAVTQRYRLGFAVVRLAGAVRSSFDLTRAARPIAERLSETTGETVIVAVLKGDEVVHIDQVNLSTSAVSVNWVARRTALHTTSTGKVFLAHLPERVREQIIGDGLVAVTPHTITDADTLRAQLELIRSQGYGATLGAGVGTQRGRRPYPRCRRLGPRRHLRDRTELPPHPRSCRRGGEDGRRGRGRGFAPPRFPRPPCRRGRRPLLI